MTKIKNIVNKVKCEEIILLAALILNGGFNEFISFIIATVISIVLIIKIVKNGLFHIYINIVSISIIGIGIGYFLSIFYAIDSGMAFLGFLKFLPIILYMLLLMQNDNKNKIIEKLPFIALTLGFLSVIGMFLPVVSNYFVVADRLAGFFQYPNTFALFLLTGELVILSKEKYKLLDFIIIILLIIFLLLTGSRTVFCSCRVIKYINSIL